MLTNKEKQKQAYHRIMNEKYEAALDVWKKNVEKWENSQKKMLVVFLNLVEANRSYTI